MEYRNRNQEEIIASNVGNDSSVTGDTVKDALETLDAAITAEDIWDRTGTTIEPKNAGDDVNIGTGIYIGSAIAPASDGTTAIQIFKADKTTQFIDFDTTNRKIIWRELATATVGNPVYNSSDTVMKCSAWDTDGVVADTHTWTQRAVPVDGNTTTSSLIWYQDTDGSPVKKMELNKDASTNTILRLQSTNDTFIAVNSSGTDRWSFGFDASPSANFFIANSGNPADTKLNLTSTSKLALGTGTVSGTYDVTLGLSVTNGNKQIGVVRQPTAATAGRDLTLNASGAYTGGTNLNGGNFIAQSGTSTGSGIADMFFQTPRASASGTGDNNPVNTQGLISRRLIDSNTAEPAGSYYDLDSGRAGWGRVQIGDNQEWAEFNFTAAGDVTLVDNSANVVKVAPFDGNLVIRDNGSNVRIVNELGATLPMTLFVIYN